MTHGESHSSPPDERTAYELEEPALPCPALPGEVIVRADADLLIDSVAADLVVHAQNCVREFGDFHLALSGDAVFEALYTRLMYDPNYRRLPWRRTHLWIVAEWDVPIRDERSNERMIREIVGDHADIPPEQFHPIRAASATADRDYEAQLREVLAWREKGQDRLDYVLLTMDPAGGLAIAESDCDQLVGRCPGPRDEGPDRITMTLPFLNAARFVAVLVIGESMADAVRRLAGGTAARREMPAAGLAPISGEIKWYLDRPACAGASGGA